MKPTPIQRSRTLAGIAAALALLEGPLPSDQERREAAEGLGMEHTLADPQDELALRRAGG